MRGMQHPKTAAGRWRPELSDDTGRYVLLINEDMEARCFPEAMRSELDALYSWTTVRSANDLSEEEWTAALRRAEILCGPWGVRKLPATDDPEVDLRGGLVDHDELRGDLLE